MSDTCRRGRQGFQAGRTGPMGRDHALLARDANRGQTRLRLGNHTALATALNLDRPVTKPLGVSMVVVLQVDHVTLGAELALGWRLGELAYPTNAIGCDLGRFGNLVVIDSPFRK